MFAVGIIVTTTSLCNDIETLVDRRPENVTTCVSGRARQLFSAVSKQQN